MDRDLVRKYRFFWGRDKNWNRGVSPHVVHYMLAEISVRNKIYKIFYIVLPVFQVSLQF